MKNIATLIFKISPIFDSKDSMSRTTHENAIILKSINVHDNKVISFLTPTQGIIEAFLFGGSKSKLRAHVCPFHEGIAWLYYDPVKKFSKIQDFEIMDSYPLIRESLIKTYTTNIIAEILLTSKAGGSDFKIMYELTHDALKAIEVSQEKDCLYPCLVFIWKMLDILGMKPDTMKCVHCNSLFSDDSMVYFQKNTHGFLCSECRTINTSLYQKYNALSISLGLRKYLQTIDTRPFNNGILISLDSKAFENLRYLLFMFIEDALDCILQTKTFIEHF